MPDRTAATVRTRFFRQAGGLRRRWRRSLCVGAWQSPAAGQRWIGLLSAAVALVAVVFYVLHVRRYFYLLDDYCLLALAQDSGLGTIFGEPLIGFYRPVVFVLLKLQFLVFGWQHPQFYAAVSVALHLANAALLAWLVRLLLPRVRLAPMLAFALFLVSPWSSEAVFWTSCQFDLAATTFGLLALVLAVKAANPQSGTGRFFALWLAATTLALAAVFCKESHVVLPGLLAVALLCNRSLPVALRSPRVWALGVSFTAATLLYLWIRGSLMPVFDGVYGNFFTMVAHARPHNLVHPFLLPPADYHHSAVVAIGRVLLVPAVVAATLLALWRHPRESALLLLGVLVALLPVIGFTICKNNTAGGRFLYLPGAVVAMGLAVGTSQMLLAAVARRRTLGRGTANRLASLGQLAVAAAALVIVGQMLTSLHYQQQLWGKATGVARRCIDDFSHHLDEGSDFYITNLPFALAEGPYLLRSYAFGYYFQQEHVRVRAEGAFWTVGEQGRMCELPRQPDIFSRYQAHADEVVLTLRYN